MNNKPAIEANFQLSFEQRQRTQSIEEWCDEYPDEAAHLIIGYADRLAQLEDGIRALADELQGEVEQHDPNKSFDEYSGGLADKAEMVEDRLRDLLND